MEDTKIFVSAIFVKQKLGSLTEYIVDFKAGSDGMTSDSNYSMKLPDDDYDDTNIYATEQLEIPLGRFSESAVEFRNKDRRKARLKFSRKNTRLNNIKDMYLLKTSDPVVNSFD